MNYEEKDIDINIVQDPSALFDKHYTYADYLQFTVDEMVEIIRGKIFKMSPAPTSWHQIISRNLCWNIQSYLRGKKCQMFNAPFDVILPVKGKDFMQSDRVVQPDIVVICDPSKIQEKGCFGAPDWVIEILSPSTSKKDIRLKYSLYEESGVLEYWIVDPSNKTVTVHLLEGESYKMKGVYFADEIVPCTTLADFSIDLKEIFE